MEGAPKNVVNAPVPPQPAPVDQNNQPEQVGNGNGNLANENSEVLVEECKLTSDVWPHYIRVKVNGVIKAKCKYCRKNLGGDTRNGTSHLRTHVKTCIQKRIHDGAQKILCPNYKATGKPQLSATQFNSDVSRKELSYMILVHEYPLSIVEHLGFKRFCCSLQPQFTVPCRNTVKKDILSLYGVERSNYQKVIDGNLGRIAVTTDLWTAPNQKRGYMAVTAHFIDNTWKLRNSMLKFLYVPTPHTSERLARKLFQCLLNWNIDGKLSAITLDNCSTNDSMIAHLKNKLVLNNLLMDGRLLHMRCSAHILNLIVKDGLDVIKDGIHLIRESVVYWTSTPKRVQTFNEAVKQVKLAIGKKLVLDCPTRWNSTYDMLSIALLYRDVFFRLRQMDSQYTSAPTNEHWDLAAIVIDKQLIFSEMTALFSGTKYPTANLFFSKVCDLRLKLSDWCADLNPVVSAMAGNMWLKFTKYWDDIHLVLAVSVVLDPRYKMHVIEYYAAKFGSSDTWWLRI
ncbi:unnamed protein product [Linum trigynum]|uniref:BED-type domain-containing protein n=1 Tax=Linum trigynum TaxID=586398 RepID=A0AAV2EG19_9ROSI